MTRKLIILIASYFIIGIITFTSCESLLKYKATICDITFAGLNSNYLIDSIDVDSFSDEVGFIIWAETKSPSCFLPVQLFSAAKATTKCAEFQNELLKSSFELSFDRELIFANDTIPAGDNLLANQKIKSWIDIEIKKECKLLSCTILFSDELIKQIKFEQGEYLVTFKCSTNDKKTFLKTRRVMFKI